MSAGQVANRDRPDTIPVWVGSECLVTAQDEDASATDVGSKHCLQDGQRYPRFMAQAGNAAVARIEILFGSCFSGQWIVVAVVVAHLRPKLAVRTGSAEGLNPRMFIGGNCLLRQLAADPVGFFGEDH